MSGLSPLARWRNAVRNSDVDATAKLVAYTIGTYMDANLVAWPSRQTIAAGASLGKGLRSVDAAIDRLEAAGLLQVIHFKRPAPQPLPRSRCAVNSSRAAGFNRASDAANRASNDTQRRTTCARKQ